MCRIQSTSTKTPLGQCVPRQDKPGLPAKRLLGPVGLEKRARGRLSHVHARIALPSVSVRVSPGLETQTLAVRGVAPARLMPLRTLCFIAFMLLIVEYYNTQSCFQSN
jgi:hypothetical protein